MYIFYSCLKPDDTVTITVAAATGIQYVTEDNKDLVEFRVSNNYHVKPVKTCFTV